MSNSKSRAVVKVKIDALAEKAGKRSSLVEHVCQREQDIAVAQNDIETLCRWTEAMA